MFVKERACDKLSGSVSDLQFLMVKFLSQFSSQWGEHLIRISRWTGGGNYSPHTHTHAPILVIIGKNYNWFPKLDNLMCLFKNAASAAMIRLTLNVLSIVHENNTEFLARGNTSKPRQCLWGPWKIDHLTHTRVTIGLLSCPAAPAAQQCELLAATILGK